MSIATIAERPMTVEESLKPTDKEILAKWEEVLQRASLGFVEYGEALAASHLCLRGKRDGAQS